MQLLKKLLLSALFVFAASGASAQGQAPTSTYWGLAWGFSSGHAGFSSCSTLFLDVTGAVGYTDNYSTYGKLSCPALGGSYASSGNAYFDSFGNFNMTVSLGVTHNLVCNNLSGSTLSGTCPIYDNLGNETGFAVINLLL